MTFVIRMQCSTKGPKLWMNKHLKFFILLQIISSDCYSVVKLIKSNIFGMDLFNSGHAHIELKKIKNIKLTMICIQNVPQIVFQILFGTILYDLNAIIIISVIISCLMSFPFLICCCLDSALSEWKEYDIDFVLIASSEHNSYGLEQIRKYKGCKKALHEKLCDILHIDARHLEIGYIDTSQGENGCKIHIIQKMYDANTDITKLYDGKYKDLSAALKQIYHISLEWTAFCSLSMDENDGKMSPLSFDSKMVPTLPPTPQAPIGTYSHYKIENDAQIPTEFIVNNGSSMVHNIGTIIVSDRNRRSTDFSDCFGVGGDDDNPFQLPLSSPSTGIDEDF